MKPFNISWPQGVIQILGIYVRHNIIEVEKANFEEKKSRNLSLKGKVLLVKHWVYPWIYLKCLICLIKSRKKLTQFYIDKSGMATQS